MKTAHSCCCLSRLLAPALLLLLPALSGPLAVLLQAAEAAPGPGPPGPGLRTLPPPPLPPGPTAARLPGRTPAAVAGPRSAESSNGSSSRAELAADDHGGKTGESSVGGGLAVSPNPGDKPMTQRALTVLMVVSGAVLVYFVVRTVRFIICVTLDFLHILQTNDTLQSLNVEASMRIWLFSVRPVCWFECFMSPKHHYL
ncbi:membrane protein FAM174A isoform X1 [Choloepus didactylus]|uniref:membrane protein FAM174A isoform X1 n=1 Tax=Choloepus didactylus TaxID=27675 RepID=UPI0018A08922|nr:membrane protein FAM174A isoform X1 [Choloepus didactylus]